MNTITRSFSNQLIVIHGGITATGRLLEAAAAVAVRAPLYLLDGGNSVNAYFLAAELQQKTREPVEALRRIYIARAFTCHQMVSLIENVCVAEKPKFPVFVLGLLSTFYDESASYTEAQRLLKRCIGLLRMASQSVPVIVGARAPAKPFPQRKLLFDLLIENAGQVWEEFVPVENGATQPGFFE